MPEVPERVMQAFELEIRKQIETALRAFSRIKKICTTKYEGPPNAEWEVNLTTQIQDDLHAFFTSVGTIAKILDPHPRKGDELESLYLARGSALQRALILDGTWKLLDRDVRNGLEHIDERIDQYLRDNPQVIYESWIIERVGHDERLNTQTVLRYFDGSSFNFKIVGANGNLIELVKELEALRARLVTEGSALMMALTDATTNAMSNAMVIERPSPKPASPPT
jgi:hypothetical protein